MKQQPRSLRGVPPFTSPFPELHVNEATREALLDATNSFLEEGVEEFERFTLDCPTRRLPDSQWRLIAEREDIRSYEPREQEPYPLPATFLTVGTVEGPVADCIFGVRTETIEQERIKAAFTKDTMCNTAILYTFEEPTVDDPHRSMKIRWYVTEMSGFFMRVFMKPRDSVYLEATGIATFSTGERIPYLIFHTVALAELPHLKECHRVESSSVIMWRDLPDNRAELFSKVYANFNEAARIVPRALRALAQSLLYFTDFAELGRLKKLMWFLRQRAHENINARKHLSASSRHALFAPTKCYLCQTVTLASKTRRVCAMCSQGLCKACCITKRIYGISNKQEVVKDHVRVCKLCWRQVIAADADQIAADEVLERHAVLTEQTMCALPTQCAPGSANAGDWSSTGES